MYSNLTTFKEHLIHVMKSKKRMNNVCKPDLFVFLKKYVDPKLRTATNKPTLIQLAEDYLTPKTLEQFLELERFGFALCDLPEALQISKADAKKLTDNGDIRLKTIINLSGKYYQMYVFDIEDMLRLEQEGLLHHIQSEDKNENNKIKNTTNI